MDINQNGESSVEVIFGPHHGLRITETEDEVNLKLVATHHGFEASASGQPTELEEIIQEVMKNNPERVTHQF